jgi:uncharacterized protein YbcI
MADTEDATSMGESRPGTTPMQSFESAASGDRHPLQEISSAMVQIYKDQFGRGPTKVRTQYAGPNTVVCVLQDTFTPAERNLQSMGEHERLRDVRMFFQYAERTRFTDPIERLTGRKVMAFISGLDTDADVAAEMFVLEPEPAPASDEPGA